MSSLVCRNCGAGRKYINFREGDEQVECLSCGCRHGFFEPSSEPMTSFARLIQETDANNTLPAHTICQLCGISGTKLRSIVHEMRMDGQPIGSGPNGYFLARHPSELDDTIEQSMSRAASIQQFVLALQRAKRSL